MKAFDRKFGKKFIASIPTSPGVYFVHDAAGEIIYVGKAKNLRRRLSQYRNAKRRKAHKKMRAIIADADRIEFELCSSDFDACVLEARLIQKLRPRWNVEGAFYFLYPMIGVRERAGVFAWCYTTQPETFPDFEFHGAYRSRGITGDAYFALIRLLEYLGHPEPAEKLLGKNWRKTKPKYSYVFAFRDRAVTPPPDRLQAWKEFLSGVSHRAIEELSLALLEHPGARRQSEDVQADLRAIHRFWRHEAVLLARIRKVTGFAQYPVPQIARDELAVRYRFLKKQKAPATWVAQGPSLNA